jgi:superfamily II DNA or RNA helicase
MTTKNKGMMALQKKEIYKTEIKKVIEDLTYINPKYLSAIKLNVYYDGEEYLNIYEQDHDCWYIPAGYKLPENIVADYKPNNCPDAMPLVINATLRDYQAQAVDAAINRGGGLIVAPCGTGKTVMGCAVMARHNTPALIIMHTGDLVRQWGERVKSFLNVDPKYITEGQAQTGRVTIATMQTLKKHKNILNHFGLIIVDECHHAPCATMADILNQCPATYRFGLSATPDRSDGLANAIKNLIGDTAYEIKTEEVSCDRITPTVFIIDTGKGKYLKQIGEAEDPQAYNKLLEAITEDNDRNDLIAKYLIRLKNAGRKILLLSPRINHLKNIIQKVPEAQSFDGKTTAKKRDELLSKLESGEISILCATPKLAAEGLDRPAIDCLVIASVIKNRIEITQAIGRIMRKAKGKKDAYVIDFMDGEKGMVGACFWSRHKIYKKSVTKINWIKL